MKAIPSKSNLDSVKHSELLYNLYLVTSKKNLCLNFMVPQFSSEWCKRTAFLTSLSLHLLLKHSSGLFESRPWHLRILLRFLLNWWWWCSWSAVKQSTSYYPQPVSSTQDRIMSCAFTFHNQSLMPIYHVAGRVILKYQHRRAAAISDAIAHDCSRFHLKCIPSCWCCCCCIRKTNPFPLHRETPQLISFGRRTALYAHLEWLQAGREQTGWLVAWLVQPIRTEAPP